MKEDSWFRGALLSVLFFGLMIGGPAPTTAVSDAGQNSPCTQWYRDGMSQPCNSPDGESTLDLGCKIFRNGDTATNMGTAAGVVGGLASGNLPLAGASAGGWALNRLIVSGCKLLGLGGG